ncbi:MAG TPA: aminoglycoside phosphotransferase family protein [Chryseolinea sp.]
MAPGILEAFGLPAECKIEPLTSGLINNTWKITAGNDRFVLQRINHQVFKRPFDIAANIRMVDDHLKEHAPQYLFVSPIRTRDHREIYYNEADGHFRLFPFVKGSQTINVVSTPEQAYEAAFHFGKFTRLLSDFDATKLYVAIPDFHNLTLRFRQFEDALLNGNANRIAESKLLINTIKSQSHIVNEFDKIKKDADVRLRVTHHDTKISNVLFDTNGKGICVIDLDTIMPGYFISDVGDMLRTYLSPANEEVKDFTEIDVREDFFRAIVQGYISTMGTALSATEKKLIIYSGQFLIYMQAMRFLTDYINNDVYYGARYPEQNLVRAGNQLQLLKKLNDKAETLHKIVLDETKHS